MDVVKLLQTRIDLWDACAQSVLDGDGTPSVIHLAEAYLRGKEARAILDLVRETAQTDEPKRASKKRGRV